MPGACSTALLLGAYYYTWYGVGEQWKAFPRTFEPSLGEYSSLSDKVMRLHHQQGRAACLDFFAVSWGGDGTRSPGRSHGQVSGRCVLRDSEGKEIPPFCTDMDEGRLIFPERGKLYKTAGWKEPMMWWQPSADIDNLILRHLEVPDGLPMALMYELRDVLGVGEGQGQVDLSAGDNPRVLEHHLLYAAEHYFMHPQYFKIHGSPVIFLYTLRDYVNFVKPLTDAFRAVEKRIGAPLYVIGDMVWWHPSPEKFPWPQYQLINVSAVTAYNMFDDSMPELMGQRFAVESGRHFLRAAQIANAHGIQVAPYVSPGYDDRKMRGGSRPTVPRAEGVMYLKSWEAMEWLLRCQPNEAGGGRRIMMVNSFNEWHEGTQIEPSVQFGESYLNWTAEFKARARTDLGQGDELQDRCDEGGKGFASWFDWSGNWSNIAAVGRSHWNASVREAAAELESAMVDASHSDSMAAHPRRHRHRHIQPARPASENGKDSLSSLAVPVVLGLSVLGCVLLGLQAKRKLRVVDMLGAMGLAVCVCVSAAFLFSSPSHSQDADDAHPAVSPFDVAHTALAVVVEQYSAIQQAAEDGLLKSHRSSPALHFKCLQWARWYAMAPWPVASQDLSEPCP